jgi:hypothetical protein
MPEATELTVRNRVKKLAREITRKGIKLPKDVHCVHIHSKSLIISARDYTYSVRRDKKTGNLRVDLTRDLATGAANPEPEFEPQHWWSD